MTISSKRLDLIAALLIIISIPSFAQIPIAKKETGSIVPNYSLRYRNPDFYSFPDGFVYDWTSMYNTKSCNYYLKGVKILLLENNHGTYLDRNAQKVNTYATVPSLSYYTIVDYFVCKEQVDSLSNVLFSYGLKVKDRTEQPEAPAVSAFGSILTPSKKKQIEEYERLIREYNSLPSSLPKNINPDYYPTASEWNRRDYSCKVIELMDENGNSYYVDELYRFLPVATWDNLLDPLVGSNIYVYLDELKLPSEWDATRPEYVQYNKNFSSVTPNYFCEKVEVNVDNTPPEVLITIKDVNGITSKGVLGSGHFRVHTESGDEELPYYTVTIDNRTYRMMSASLFNYYKKNYEELQSKRTEFAKSREEEQRLKIKGYKEKYGEYYGEQIGNHKIVAGMSKEMCIESWGEPLYQRTESEANHIVEYLKYGLFLHRSIILVDGKVSQIIEESL